VRRHQLLPQGSSTYYYTGSLFRCQAHIMGYVKMQIKDVKLDYNLLNLIMLTLLLMVFSHWMACMWRLVPQLEHAEVDWLDYFGFESDDVHMYEVREITRQG
jgi:hypothetical protein